MIHFNVFKTDTESYWAQYKDKILSSGSITSFSNDNGGKEVLQQEEETE